MKNSFKFIVVLVSIIYLVSVCKAKLKTKEIESMEELYG